MGRFGSSFHYLSFNQCNNVNGLTQNEINKLKDYLENDFLNICDDCNEKGDKGDKGIKGNIGTCMEPRELIYTKLNILENISLDCFNYCELINTYFLNFKILNTNIENLFIENDSIYINDLGMYNCDVSLHINYLNKYKQFNTNLIIFSYDNTINDYIPLKRNIIYTFNKWKYK